MESNPAARPVSTPAPTSTAPDAWPSRVVLLILTSRQAPPNEDQTSVGGTGTRDLTARTRADRRRCGTISAGPAPGMFIATANARRRTDSALAAVESAAVESIAGGSATGTPAP